MSQTKSQERYQGFPYVKPLRITEVQESHETNTPLENETREEANNKSDRVPYHGFPYVHRIVTDAPTLKPDEVAALAKYQNLPRRQYSSRDFFSNQSTPTSPTTPGQADIAEEPDASSNPDRPVVYIDIPDGPSGVLDRPNWRADGPGNSKPDLDLDRPVVYIDIPQNSGSGVSQSIEEEEPAYVQDTILYDQFKDRRIELPQDSDSEDSESSSHQRPNTLNIRPTGSSGFGLAATSPSNYTSYQSKEAYIYGQGQTPTSNDEFPLTPLPVTDYPAYPPPYAEIDQNQTTAQCPVTEQPMTQVITNAGSPPVPLLLDGRRKLLVCQHCNSTVQTVVAEESGLITHLIGCLFFLFLIPLVLLVYCTGIFKYRNHYCPTCNKKIGYQAPSCCSDEFTYA